MLLLLSRIKQAKFNKQATNLTGAGAVDGGFGTADWDVILIHCSALQ